jgi:hypothetical protein
MSVFFAIFSHEIAMKTYQHIIFWILVYAALTLIFTDWFGSRVEAFYYVSLLLPVVMGTSYFFNYYLVPRFLFTRRLLKFCLYSFYMLVVSLCLELLASVIAMLVIMSYGINKTGALFTDVFTLAGILYFIVILKSFLLLIKHYFVDQRTISELEEKQLQMEQGFITVRSNRRTAQVMYDDLVYIESLADYIKIHQAGGEEIISKEKISHIEKELPHIFVRIHRSFIVNRNHITSFSSEEVVLGDTELPISRTYRREVLPRLRSQ